MMNRIVQQSKFQFRGMWRILGLLSIAVAASCTQNEIPQLQLPATSIISVRKSWVVVRQSYVPLYSEPGIEADIHWHARRGDVFEVIKQSLETEFLFNEEEYWFFIEHEDAQGWAFGAGLESYSTREEALDAATKLESGEGF